MKAGLIVCLFLFVFQSHGYQPTEQKWFYDGDFDIIIRNNKDTKEPLKQYYYSWALGAKALFSDNLSNYDAFSMEFERLTPDFEKSNSTWSKFLFAEYHFINSIVAMRREQELMAIWSFRTAYQGFHNVLLSNPDFKPAIKSLGMMELIIGAVPEEYKWLLDLLGWEGSVTSGAGRLTSLSGNPTFKVEATLFLAMYQCFLLQRYDEALFLIHALNGESKGGEMLKLAHLVILAKSGNSTGILNYSDQNSPFSYLYFLRAEAHLQAGNYKIAIQEYNRFLENYSGENLLKDVYYKIYVCYFLQNDLKRAEFYKNKIAEKGKEILEADRYAIMQMESERGSNKTLLEARLAMDGGFYDRSDSLLNVFMLYYKSSDVNFQLEYRYRRARLFHLTGNVDKAIEYYLLVIENQGEKSYYFAPNSALQLGLIFSDRKEKDHAIRYLKLAQTYKRHEYKKSIDRKSRALLSQIEAGN
ncbi:MAG: tetratricopeptide repeat protein [Cyclobacteriaceae bacterium]|nr:tetratricopeptide repeat protein [Cyclobacteriaceae bacterium]